MRALKAKDCAGNIYYVKCDEVMRSSIVIASISDKPYQGYITKKFFRDYKHMNSYLSSNENKIIIGKGCLSCGIKYGNTRDNHLYFIEQ